MAEAEMECLARARAAAKQNNASAMHVYYALFLAQYPEQGGALAEYLAAARRLHRGEKTIVEIGPDGALSRIFGTQNSRKVLEACAEKLKLNPYDLDNIYRMGRAAQNANWHAMAIAAFEDLLKGVGAGTGGSQKVSRELKHALGRAHFQLKQYKTAFDYLKEFQADPAAPNEVLQMIKDASALVAAVPFQQNQPAHRIATAQSVTLATQSPQEREEQEVRVLEASLHDEKLEHARRVAAALQLSGLYSRAGRVDAALKAIAAVSKAGEFNADLETHRVTLQLRQTSDEIDALAASARTRPELRAALEKRQIEHDARAAAAYADLAGRIPTDGNVRLKLAESLYAIWKRSAEERLLKQAIEHLQVDFKNDEQHNRSRLLLAECFIGLGLAGTAEIVLLEFIQRLEQRGKDAVTFLEAQYLLGVVRERAENLPGATQAYMAVVSRNILYKDAFDRLRRLEDRKARQATARSAG